MAIRALIFDFDGLILDTETAVVEVWKTIYADHGFVYPLENWSLTIGGWGISNFDPAEALQRLSNAPLDLPGLHRRHSEESNAWIERQPIMPGVMDHLEAAKRMGLRLIVASSSERDWVEPHLSRLGLLDRFEKVICGDDVAPGRTKPHPDIFFKVLAELKMNADEALVLEDSPHGVQAARSAGLRVVAVQNPVTAQLSLDSADVVLESLADVRLEDLLARLNSGKTRT